ncbi:unknown [Halorubrum sp. DM2]|nr:unknown [Halorubrum sp. DM2]
MIGTTLAEIRDHIESLASDDGEYYLICARYGDRPVPASDLRFDTRATARAAAQATTQYRQALRRYDPQVPYYDIVACQAVDIQTRCARIERRRCDSQSTYPAALAEPVVKRSLSVARELVEFCHRVAAAVFETLSERGYDAVESAIMDAYFAHAEELSDPNGLCIRLLESMAVELADHLNSSEQVAFLSAAAERLEHEPRDATGSPMRSSGEQSVDESLSVLQNTGLYSRGSQVTDSEADGCAAELIVDVSGYALQPSDGRLPLLPIALTVHRCDDAWVPTRVDTSGNNIQISFRPVEDSETLDQSGPVFAPEVR